MRSSLYFGIEVLQLFEDRARQFNKLYTYVHSCPGILGREVVSPLCKTLASYRPKIFFFPFVFCVLQRPFSIFFVQYLGVTAGIEPAT
jgi:hypothetical protein